MERYNKPKTEAEIASMRTGGKMLATVLEVLRQQTVAGITSKELALIAAKELKALGGKPAFLGFEGYPDVICISVNEEVQHTIPRKRVLNAGDVVNYDFGVLYDGLITDAGISTGVGKVSADVQRLLDGTRKALERGLGEVRNGARVGNISAAVEKQLKAHHLGIVYELQGHGVGHEMHEEPGIPNYGRANRGPILRTGMTICIEPIANLGSGDIVIADDDWTLLAEDNSWSAQFEHSILVTETGAEILTQL